ncbi:3-isopropylmalate dehydratase small subunit [Paralcaligenes ureilyticus]|uniref:3-isopropylmalate dehydratase small subunit n=1 Tax=Paralcaligenes ureilyticus TaxID=627131 RepID=A0A4R3MCE6_9BURK|nr:3-isopropylmalate dehydratase small subunit [Paralcaligenes ureilyticus]TCT11076.1 3-isopropylmalate dehydratase small subunit [Paralcaligenes ureilyticus]
MEPFGEVFSHVVPIDRTNVDTDAILPKQYMALTTRTGFGDFLFDSWRYEEAGAPGIDNSKRTLKADFALNDPRYRGAGILLARQNFGCGSSREHAVWALAQWGVRVLIAPSFADIFYGNCFKNGILPICLSAPVVSSLFDAVRRDGRLELTIDLPNQKVIAQTVVHEFDIDPARKRALLLGIDEISEILGKHQDALQDFERRRMRLEPWLATER